MTSRHQEKQAWTPKTAKDLENISVWPDRVFNVEERFNEETDKVLEFHYTKILRNIYFLAMDVFAGEGDLTGKQSPWVHQYPNEFYEHVKAIARPDPHGRHWEGLLRDKYERVFLVVGIVMRVLDTSIFSSLMFGASDKHQKALEAHDIDLIEYDGFERNRLMVHMNEVYLRETGGTPPFAGDHWRRITSQIVTMLLPLYNMVGEEFTDSIPSLEKFCQGLGNIVSYAAWLAITTHLTPGITVLEWLPPGDDYRLEQSNVLHDVFERSRAKARKYDKRIGASKPRTGRVKISVAPSIVYYPPPKPGSKAEGYFEGYRVLRPHAVYYFGLLDSIEDAKTLVPLWDYLRRVSKRRGSPPALLVLLICVSAWCLFWKGLIYLWDEAAYGAWSVTLFAKINEGW